MRLTVLLGLTLVLASPIPAHPKSQDSQQSQPEATAPTCTRIDEDYAVYSAVLDNLGQPEDPEAEWRNKREIVVEDSTSTGINADKVGWRFKSTSRRQPQSETVENYDARTTGSCHLQANFTAKVLPIMVSHESINDYFKKKGDGWGRFYKDHPQAGGFLELLSGRL